MDNLTYSQRKSQYTELLSAYFGQDVAGIMVDYVLVVTPADIQEFHERYFNAFFDDSIYEDCFCEGGKIFCAKKGKITELPDYDSIAEWMWAVQMWGVPENNQKIRDLWKFLGATPSLCPSYDCNVYSKVSIQKGLLQWMFQNLDGNCFNLVCKKIDCLVRMKLKRQENGVLRISQFLITLPSAFVGSWAKCEEQSKCQMQKETYALDFNRERFPRCLPSTRFPRVYE